MKKALAILLMVMVNVAVAADWENPDAKFDASKKLTNRTTINWITVDDVQATCEAESRKVGNGGFGYAIQACSFWQQNTCTIITAKSTSIHTLGHETRHCFQGNYH